MQAHSGPVVASRGDLTAIDCAVCGHAHLWPMPDLPADYYASDFWQREKSGWLARYEEQRDWLDATNGDWLSVLSAHVSGTTILDVGCGWGFFIMAANDMGWTAYGIEPSAAAVQYIHRHSLLPVHAGGYEDYRGGEYSAISALWLMEHLPDPLSFLRWCRSHLRPDGALLLAVPNEFTWQQREAGQAAAVKGYWLHETHINYWSAATFANLLGRAGFRIVDRLGTFEMETFISLGMDYTANEAMGAGAHAKVRADELALNRGQRIVQGRARGQIGAGRDMVIVAKAGI